MVVVGWVVATFDARLKDQLVVYPNYLNSLRRSGKLD